jgi:hypothetical protein
VRIDSRESLFQSSHLHFSMSVGADYCFQKRFAAAISRGLTHKIGAQKPQREMERSIYDKSVLTARAALS